MTTNSAWTPSFMWHVKTVILCLVFCSVALAALWYITDRLPAPYQRYTPVTPTQWEQSLSQEENK
ncbi:MAG: hypothetical protein J6V32_06315 [Elusimicrobiaceae bacterium]|nr:hypothetical protein [Elusimicrobiaceae bacterium]